MQVARTYFIVRVSLSQHSQRGMPSGERGEASIPPYASQSRIRSNWCQGDLLTPRQLASGANRRPCVRSRLSALQEAVGCNTESGERDQITPPDTGSNRKESIGKTPQRRNGRAGRADWRTSVTVDPMVIECPENCRNGIAGGTAKQYAHRGKYDPRNLDERPTVGKRSASCKSGYP